MVFWDSRVVHCNTNAKEKINNIVEQHNDATQVMEVEGNINDGSNPNSDTLDLSNFVDRRKRVLDVITRLKNIREYNNFPIEKKCIDIQNNEAAVELQRIVSLISMAPKVKATEDVLALRRLAYVNEQTTTHWPFRFEADEPTNNIVKRIEDITPLMKQLIG